MAADARRSQENLVQRRVFIPASTQFASVAAGTIFRDHMHTCMFLHVTACIFLEMAGLQLKKTHARFRPVNMKSMLKLNMPLCDLFVRLCLHMSYIPLVGKVSSWQPTFLETPAQADPSIGAL